MDHLTIHAQDKAIKELVRQELASKEEVIKRRLKELGIELDFNQEKRRRFKSLMVERIGGEETYYYNDGSTFGMRLVTFVTTQKPIDTKERSVSITLETHYF